MDKNIAVYAGALSVVALIEAIQGFALGNGHVIKDFVAGALLLAMLAMSYRAA